MASLWTARRRSSITSLVLAGLVVATSGRAPIAFAQTAPPAAATTAPPTREQLAQAKKFFDAGNKLYKEGLYQEALASFLEANRIAPRESIQRNIGQTYRDLKDMASAYEAYELLLANYGDKMKPALKSDAQHALEELQVLTGVIAIGVQEPGAHVTIDRKDVGQTPLAKPVRANIGAHAVRSPRRGSRPSRSRSSSTGTTRWRSTGRWRRRCLTGHVSVDVETAADAAVKILLDGKDAGAPPWQGDLDPGMHTIEAKGSHDGRPAEADPGRQEGDVQRDPRAARPAGDDRRSTWTSPTRRSRSTARSSRTASSRGPSRSARTRSASPTRGYDLQEGLIVHDGEKSVENVALQKEAQPAVAAATAAAARLDGAVLAAEPRRRSSSHDAVERRRAGGRLHDRDEHQRARGSSAAG